MCKAPSLKETKGLLDLAYAGGAGDAYDEVADMGVPEGDCARNVVLDGSGSEDDDMTCIVKKPWERGGVGDGLAGGVVNLWMGCHCWCFNVGGQRRRLFVFWQSRCSKNPSSMSW